MKVFKKINPNNDERAFRLTIISARLKTISAKIHRMLLLTYSKEIKTKLKYIYIYDIYSLLSFKWNVRSASKCMVYVIKCLSKSFLNKKKYYFSRAQINEYCFDRDRTQNWKKDSSTCGSQVPIETKMQNFRKILWLTATSEQTMSRSSKIRSSTSISPSEITFSFAD